LNPTLKKVAIRSKLAHILRDFGEHAEALRQVELALEILTQEVASLASLHPRDIREAEQLPEEFVL
jgi:hypothetical protein